MLTLVVSPPMNLVAADVSPLHLNSGRQLEPTDVGCHSSGVQGVKFARRILSLGFLRDLLFGLVPSQSASGLAHSKTWRLALALCLLSSAFCPCATAQYYSTDRSTIDGGGGTCTGGVYSVDGVNAL